MLRAFLLKARKIKMLLIFVGIFASTCYFLNIWAMTDIKNSINLQYVVVHFDFKGAPPKLAYLRSILPKLLGYGVNALLFEYEDMFPYEGTLANLSAKNCYGRSELKDFINFTIQLGFEVIPLVQTFGHLEFALKLEEFRHLREHPDYPDSICPSKKESKDLVSNILQQVVTFHASVSPLKHIHVGCDEVYRLNHCKLCLSTELQGQELYVNHIRYISSLVGNINPNITVLIWDDMLRKIRPTSWVGINNFRNIEPVHWRYEELHKFPYVYFINFDKKFKNKWAATAYKGADGSTATVPNIRRRLSNHYSWMKHLQNVSSNNVISKFKGIILTGWSRYNHMQPLCELLPVALPSLFINLETVQLFRSGGNYRSKNIDEFFKKYLYYNKFRSIELSQYSYTFCASKGHILCKLLHDYQNILNYVYSFLNTDEIYAAEYYCHSKMFDRGILINYITNCSDSLKKLQNIEKVLVNAMNVSFEGDVIEEYLGYKTYYLQRKLNDVKNTFTTCLVNNVTLERRPIF